MRRKKPILIGVSDYVSQSRVYLTWIDEGIPYFGDLSVARRYRSEYAAIQDYKLLKEWLGRRRDKGVFLR